MATSGEMIRIVADALALPTATVTSYHGVLRQERLITKGGRGRSAAAMSATDVAKLLITLMGSDCLEEAAAVCRLLSYATFPGVDADDMSGISKVDLEVMTLLDAVVILLIQMRCDASRSGKKTPLLPIIEIASSDDTVLEIAASLLEARIVSQRISLEFQYLAEIPPITYPDDWMSLPPKERLLARSQIGGLLIRRSVDELALKRVARALPDE